MRRRVNRPKKRREKHRKRAPSPRLLRALYAPTYRANIITEPAPSGLLPDEWLRKSK
jgi:hypothetical protein